MLSLFSTIQKGVNCSLFIKCFLKSTLLFSTTPRSCYSSVWGIYIIITKPATELLAHLFKNVVTFHAHYVASMFYSKHRGSNSTIQRCNMKPNQVASYLEYKPQIGMNQETQSFESINSNHWKERKRPCHAIWIHLCHYNFNLC